MRVLVAGGAGFLGSHLCERWLGRGAEVVAFDSLLTGRLSNVASLVGRRGFSFVRGDVCEGLDVPGRFELVLQLASPASPADYARHPVDTLRAGAEGTLNALEFARARGAAFVLASTCEIYGFAKDQSERSHGYVDPIGPRCAYEEAKRFAESLAWSYRRHYGLPVRVARLFSCYGPRMREDDGRAVPSLIGRALTGRPLLVFGDGSQERSFTYVDDMVDGLEALVAHDPGGPLNLGNPRSVTLLELAELIRRLAGSSSPIEFLPRTPGDPDQRRPDVSLARRSLSWSPRVTLEAGLARTIESFRGRMLAPRVAKTA